MNSEEPEGLSGEDQWTIQQLLEDNRGLRTALGTRDVIGQAKGVVRLLLRCGPQEAFDLLARMSQDTNRRVNVVAELVAEWAGTGTPLPADLAASWYQRMVVIQPGRREENTPGDSHQNR